MRAVLEPADLHRYDELNDSHGAMRAHWRPLIDRLRADESPDAVRRSLELTRRLVVENGVTYNVYADPQGADRPWALDPLPFVLPAAEWQAIEAGVAQRARLLNALLVRSLRPAAPARRRPHPAELPFGHPNYLWPATTCSPPTAPGCTSTPRISRARRMAAGGCSPIARRRRRARVRAREPRDPRAGASRSHSRHGGAPRARILRHSARAHARRGRRRISARVILTPGPYNETYFEHAFSRASSACRWSKGTISRARRHGLPEDARRPAARALDPAPPRRRLLRSARIARRLGAGRARD
jgi:hypothetical protein